MSNAEKDSPDTEKDLSDVEKDMLESEIDMWEAEMNITKPEIDMWEAEMNITKLEIDSPDVEKDMPESEIDMWKVEMHRKGTENIVFELKTDVFTSGNGELCRGNCLRDVDGIWLHPLCNIIMWLKHIHSGLFFPCHKWRGDKNRELRMGAACFTAAQ